MAAPSSGGSIELVAGDGDARHRAFVAHYARAAERLRAQVLALVRDRDLAEDVIQDLALTLWARFDDYDPARPFLPWARGVARFKIMKAWERSTRRLPGLSEAALESLESAWGAVDDDVPVELDALEACLGEVPARGRDLIRLRYDDDLPLETIARCLRSSLTAVTKALSRLRARLADCVQQRMQQEGAW